MKKYKIEGDYIYSKEYCHYENALEMCGAKVLKFETFGSYQGNWYAVVEYNSDTFLVKGSYGSCSGCDAFYSEFDGSGDSTITFGEDGFSKDLEKQGYQQGYKYKTVLIFGKSYLNDPQDINSVMREVEETCEWDMEAKIEYDWLKEIKQKYFKG